MTDQPPNLDALIQDGGGNSLGGGDENGAAVTDESMELRTEVLALNAILTGGDSKFEAKEEEFRKFQGTLSSRLNSGLSIDAIFDVVDLVLFTASVVFEGSKIDCDEIEKAIEEVVGSLTKKDE